MQSDATPSCDIEALHACADSNQKACIKKARFGPEQAEHAVTFEPRPGDNTIMHISGINAAQADMKGTLSTLVPRGLESLTPVFVC